MRPSRITLVVAAIVGCSGAAAPVRRDPALRVEWPVYGGDASGLRYSILTDINAGNVARLEPAWSWKAGEHRVEKPERGEPSTPGPFEATPVMLSDTLYFSTSFSRAVALDAITGKQLWVFDPEAERWGKIMGSRYGFVHRGVAVWTGPAGRRVFLNSRWKLFALDAATGQPIPSFGRDGVVDLTENLRWPVDRYELANTSPPLVVGHLVIVGSAVDDKIIHDHDPPGDLQAFDVETGQRVWKWDPIPRAGEPGSDTWEPSAAERTGHANTWTPFTADTARGLIYIPVSTPSNDWYGGRRKGNNLYAESLVCLDARTGKRVWHFQLVHHGLWDYDPPTPPALITFPVKGKPVDAVIVAGKTGYLYAFDRVTGAPIWPIVETPVPASDVPGEQASPTQPIPAAPAPFARLGVTEADLLDWTPELHAKALETVKPYRLGPLFAPPSLQGTIVMPGWIGGAGWGAMTLDPEAFTVYIKSTNSPTLGRVVPADSLGYRFDSRVPPLSFPIPGPNGRNVRFPVIKPPYGTLTAIDLSRGAQRWQVTLGDMPEIRFHPAVKALNLPPLGVVGAVGGVVTRGGLIFITGGGKTLYAIDKGTGKILWEFDLRRAGLSNPMTYRTSTGRQFVVVATGEFDDAVLRSFALPEGSH